MKQTNKEIYRDLILSSIITFGRYNKPINSTQIHEKSDKQLKLDDFQRVVTKVIEDYQNQQLERMEQGQPYNLILSINGGYFVPQNAQEATEGIIFYSERILPMFQRRKNLKRMAQRKFQEKTYFYKKDVPAIKQEGLKFEN